MSLWGTTTADGDKPKFLPVDSNAAGSTGAREHLIASKSGWALSPGLAASGNDNADAQPEILVCIKNLAEAMGNASIIGIDWTDGEVADTGTFDIVVTFDEAVDITSAARSANQTVTNKAFILLSRLGATDMVEDSTVACQYFSGDGTNQLTFRGLLQTGSAAYLGFNGSGIGDDAFSTGIIFNGSAALDEEDGNSVLGVRQEAGTAASPSFGDAIILNGTAGAVATVNGALSGATTLVVDGVSGTLAVGQVITVQSTGSASISDSDGNTGISTDNTLTITAVASQTSVTVSEAITVANDIVLLAMANGGDEVIADGVSLTVAGPTFASRSDMTLIARVGETLGGDILLEQGAQDTGRDTLVMDASDGSSSDENDQIDLEDKTSGIATYVQAGSTSGTAYVLNGVTVAAA
tara:strand:- start:474 stop:1703 length:1230 start_codon:yes stop_codon:yes gene_type:complete